MAGVECWLPIPASGFPEAPSDYNKRRQAGTASESMSVLLSVGVGVGGERE